MVGGYPVTESPTLSSNTPPGDVSRNAYIDFMRAFSLLIVVAWHWVFTIIHWDPDGPHATNPIGFTTGMWAVTWLLQVMPLFFYVGGYSHLTSWERARGRGEGLGHFVRKRVRSLVVPSLALFGVWVVLGLTLFRIFGWVWIRRAVYLVISPLWFMAVYICLVALLPVFLWLHRRLDMIALVLFAAIAGAVDIVRFHYHHEWIGMINMLVVWGLCHQLGFFYERIVHAPRNTDWSLLLGGMAALAGLVFSGLYPGSMVGVPGQKFSNMAPPTLTIVALLLFQAGLAEILRPKMEVVLERPRWQNVNRTINRFSLPLFLFHTTGLALYLAVRFGIAGKHNETRVPTLGWWLSRPLAFIGPLLFTLPVIYLFGRRWVKPKTPA